MPVPSLVTVAPSSGTWGREYWPAYLLAATVAFLVPEGIALATGHGNTLTYWVWGQLGKYTAQWYLSLGFYVTVMSWLVWHFWFREFH